MDQQPVIQCCSINGKVCRNGKREDFPVDDRTQEKFVCNEWVNVKGIHPQTGGEVDNWMCAKFAHVLMLNEIARQMKQAGASTDKVANEVRKHHQTFFNALNDDAKGRLLDSQADQNINLIDGKGA